jgi:hypothetical protein
MGEMTRLDVTVGKGRSSFVKRVVLGPAWKRYTRRTTIKGLDEFLEDVAKSVSSSARP